MWLALSPLNSDTRDFTAPSFYDWKAHRWLFRAEVPTHIPSDMQQNKMYFAVDFYMLSGHQYISHGKRGRTTVNQDRHAADFSVYFNPFESPFNVAEPEKGDSGLRWERLKRSLLKGCFIFPALCIVRRIWETTTWWQDGKHCDTIWF